MDTHGGEMGREFGMFNIDDCVFYSNSYTMDNLTNMYQYSSKVDRMWTREQRNSMYTTTWFWCFK